MTGKVPVYDPDRGFRVWLDNEIYTGPNGTGTMVPNLGDAKLIWNIGWHRCITVDPSSKLSTWVFWQFTEQNDIDNIDILLGVGPGYTSETFRAYLDTKVKPHRLQVDSRCHTYGTMSSHYKVFLGTDISESGRVISAYYDADDNYTGENVPFELVARSDVDNLSIKAPMAGFCSLPLKDGELVTLVAYNSLNGVVGINKLLIKNTKFIRRSEAGKLAITHISLTSPWLADDVENTLRIPMNLPLEALSLRGKVHYSNGHVRDVPIDGAKMTLYGLDNYVSTINGQPAPLVLTYKLSPNEATTGAQGGAQYHISIPYRAISTEVAGTYSVKLYPVPEWKDEFTGWIIQWYLYNLDRGDFYPVTNLVEMGTNSTPYDPMLFGTKQYITVAVDMQRVDPRLAQYRHVQTMAITLTDNGLADSTPYYIEFDPGQDPDFGGNYACRVTYESVGNYKVNLSNGILSLQEWLDKLYYAVKPLYDRQTETGPLLPTHFVLNLNGFRTKYPLARWNTILDSVTGGRPGSGAMIEWVREVSGSTLQLACTPLKIYHDVPSSGGGSPTLNLYPAWASAIGDTGSMWFGSSATSTLVLSADGTGLADWTTTYDDNTGDVVAPPIEFTFADGSALANTTFEVMVEIDSRYENGVNRLYPTCILNQWLTLTNEFPIPVKLSGWVGAGAYITLRLSVRDKANPTNIVTGLYTMRQGDVPT